MAKKIIQITVKGDKIFDEILKEVKLDEQALKEEIDATGDLIVQDMKDIINTSKVRPQAGEPTKLEDAITIDKFKDGGFGVGDIEKLNKEAPHWPALNWGSSHMVGKKLPRGSFDPDPEDGRPNEANFREGRWKKGGRWSPIVKRPIIGINFLERTINILISLVNQIKLRGK